MRHREGPAKRLAPAISTDIHCPHSFADDEGVQLEINCEDCAGAHDLTNGRCMMGVVNVISGAAIPETIILKRFTHKRYRNETVKTVSTAAAELSALSRALSTPDSASDNTCRTCSASRRQVVSRLKSMLLEDPMGYVTKPERVNEEVRRVRVDVSCGHAGACIDLGLATSVVLNGGPG